MDMRAQTRPLGRADFAAEFVVSVDAARRMLWFALQQSRRLRQNCSARLLNAMLPAQVNLHL